MKIFDVMKKLLILAAVIVASFAGVAASAQTTVHPQDEGYNFIQNISYVSADEYDAYIQYVPDNSPEVFADTIMGVCELPEAERLEIGARGRDFVLAHKTALVQTKRILEFIANL